MFLEFSFSYLNFVYLKSNHFNTYSQINNLKLISATNLQNEVYLFTCNAGSRFGDKTNDSFLKGQYLSIFTKNRDPEIVTL